jgi:hypothetical protein
LGQYGYEENVDGVNRLLLEAFAEETLGYRCVENSVRLFFPLPSVRRGDTHVAVIMIGQNTGEIVTLWIMKRIKAFWIWTPFPPCELFLILTSPAIN